MSRSDGRGPGLGVPPSIEEMDTRSPDPRWVLWVYLLAVIAILGALIVFVYEWMSRPS